jgi:hypothetical protein
MDQWRQDGRTQAGAGNGNAGIWKIGGLSGRSKAIKIKITRDPRGTPYSRIDDGSSYWLPIEVFSSKNAQIFPSYISPLQDLPIIQK